MPENGKIITWQNMGEVRAELFTPEEIAESNLRVAFIMARQAKGITQKKLEELSGVKQPVIARFER